MDDLNVILSQLDAELTKRGLCWSVGSTRLCRIECRIWPMDQAQSKPVIIQSGESIQDAVEKAMERLEATTTKIVPRLSK